MSDAPQGNYIELDANLVDDGRLISQLTDDLRRVHQDLTDFEDATGDKGKKAKVVVEIEIGRAKGLEEFMQLGYSIKRKTPTETHTTLVRAAGGRMLVDNDTKGAGLNNRDQMRLFDKQGNLTHQMDPDTGELVKAESDVAGKIKAG